MVEEAIILAGGMGTRLGDLSGNRPKSMMPVAGQPFLSHVLNYLAGQGIRKVHLSVGHRAENIIKYYGDKFGEMQLYYAIESEPLDTGGALLNGMANTQTTTILAINGDTWFPVDVGTMYHQFLAAGADLSIAVKYLSEANRYGTLEMDKSGRIIAFEEKSKNKAGYINGGTYLIDRKWLLRLNLPKVFSWEYKVLQTQFRTAVVFAYKSDVDFIDIGIPADYQKAQHVLAGS